MKRWPLFVPLLLHAQNPASVWITAPDNRVILGASVQLTVLARDSSGRPLPNASCTWSRSGNSIFTVNSSGVATAPSLGIGDIAATCANVTNTVRLQSIPSAIVVTPAEKQINVGDTLSYSAQVLDVNGNAVPNVPLTWNVIGEDGNNTASVFITSAGGGTGLATLTTVGVGRFTVRATLPYGGAGTGLSPGPGQFIQQYYGRGRVTVSPP